MSVRNAGTAIREARLKAGLSQEELSDGICSVLSLSRIENGTSGVSPSTFQALMAHAGAPCEAFPSFANRTDFDCFYTLKQIRFYLDSWQLAEAYEKLEKVELMNYAKNKYYYQEWLFLYGRLQFRSGLGNHANIYEMLLNAWYISRPKLEVTNFQEMLLSLNEIELLISIAQEALYLNNLEVCLKICTQIFSYLENSKITLLEKDHLLAENAVVYIKYLIAIGEYNSVLSITDIYTHKMINNTDDTLLHELTFLKGLSHYYLGHLDEALLCFKMVFFSAHSIQSCYATICRNYLLSNLRLSLPEGLLTVPDIPLNTFPEKKIIDSSFFSDGTYDLSSGILTIGALIQQLRMEQCISQETLCQGLCSKSKLSKIENGFLQPDIALAQTLLQRLGKSDTVFTFFGNSHEEKLQNLRLRLTQTPLTSIDEILTYSQEMLKLCSSKDVLYIQYAIYRKSRCICDSHKNAQALLDALNITVPNFDFNNMHNYHLSWLELTILNNYCAVYSDIAPSKAILYLYKLLDYYDYSKLDILEKKRFFSVTLNTLIRKLYNQKRFAELVELAPYIHTSSLKCSLYFNGIIFAHYSQALGELKKIDFAYLFANYAYYILLITNQYSEAEKLKNTLYSDFNITLI